MNGLGLSLALLCAPVWTGCYATVSTKRNSHEEITSRTQVRQPDQVEVLAAPAPLGEIRVEATQRQLCRLELAGVDRPTVVQTSRKERSGYLAGGLTTLLGAVFVVAGSAQVKDSGSWYTPERRASEKAEGERNVKIGYGIGGAGLAMLATYLFLPSQRVVTTNLPEVPVKRWDGPATTCDGSRPAPVQVPILASTAFAGSKATLDVRASTGANGVLEFSQDPLARAAGWCGAPVLKVGVDPAAKLPGGAVAGPVAQLTLQASPRQPIEGLRAIDPVAAATALACCSAQLGPQLREDCEERCARAAGVPKCLFGRRSCLMKAARAVSEPEKSAALCENLYAECVVAGGASRRNLDACGEVCFDKHASEACQ